MDHKIEILNSETDQEKWMQAVCSLPCESRDVFLLPGYAKVFSAVYGAQGSLFLYSKGDFSGLHVFLRRSIGTLPFAGSLELPPGTCDIITPEYSGPAVSCADLDAFACFWEEFSRYCNDNNIIAEFGRLNPYYLRDPALLQSIGARLNREIVCVGLEGSEHDIWKGFSKGNKSSIKKAGREGVKIKKVEWEQGGSDFHRLYTQTMQRNEAKSFYHFSYDFFSDLFTHLKGNASLFQAVSGADVVASSIFLHYGPYVHYYFSGSDEKYFHLCPNNLLLHEVILWARSSGYRILSLGGGYHNSGQDNLFAFKCSFSPLRASFHTYNKVHMPEMYTKLCACWKDFYKAEKDMPADGFFPLYRKEM